VHPLGCIHRFQLRARLGFSLSMLPGRRGVTPVFGYGVLHPNARGTLTLLIWALPSTHYEPLRLPPPPPCRYVFRRGVVGDSPSPTRRRVSQVPGSSVSIRRPLTPRGARSPHTLVASRSMLASPSLAGWPLPLLNGAEPGSLALRLTDSPPEASTIGLLPPPLGKLSDNEQFSGQAPFILLDHPGFS
jgi:hypothetical protein